MHEAADGRPDGALSALEADYRFITLLKEGNHRLTALHERKCDGVRAVIKAAWSDPEIALLENEEKLLARIHKSTSPQAEFFPSVIGSRDSDGCRILILSYIEGCSMRDYVESEFGGSGIERTAAIRCVCAVLDQLEFLHGMNPPILHRDIKPENVILDSEGRFHLIDLGISRTGSGGRKPDTLVMGTAQFAPPEQFGYRGTDIRSDLYSAGVLLRYCLTQEWEESADAGIDRDLRTIVEKATRFDPDRRYRTAKEMRRALEKARRASCGRGRRAAFAAIPAAVLALCIALYAALSPRTDAAYSFREPLIEQAVRSELGIPQGSLTRARLEQISALHVFGKQIYRDDSEFWFLGEHAFPLDDSIGQAGLWRENGGIESLEDIRALPNLEELCLYRQNIRDLSPLKGRKLSRVGIGFNPLADLSPLSGSDSITSLNLCCLSPASLAPVRTLANLRELCVAGVPVGDLSLLSSLPITRLNLADASYSETGALAGFTSLQSLTLSKIYPGIPQQLADLPLRELEITHTWNVSLSDLKDLNGLERLSYATQEGETIGPEPLPFPNMREIDLKGVRLESLECLGQMTKLETLGIYESQTDDFRGLEKLPALRTVYANEAQKAVLEKTYPDRRWECRS
ncbi:MAG: protein kinase [Clostridia bacterium]|nr:protein kinase [Clostridia bacterium]